MHYLAVLLGLMDSMVCQASLVPGQKYWPLSPLKQTWVLQMTQLIWFIRYMVTTPLPSPGTLVCHTPPWPVCGTFCAPAVCSWCICSLVFQDPRYGPRRWHSGLAAREGRQWKMGKQAHIILHKTTKRLQQILEQRQRQSRRASAFSWQVKQQSDKQALFS